MDARQLVSVAGDCDDLDPEVHPDAISNDEIGLTAMSRSTKGCKIRIMTMPMVLVTPVFRSWDVQPTDKIVDNDPDCDDINTSISPAVLETMVKTTVMVKWMKIRL